MARIGRGIPDSTMQKITKPVPPSKRKTKRSRHRSGSLSMSLLRETGALRLERPPCAQATQRSGRSTTPSH